ncbi:MAG: transcription termination factor Rho [Sphaerochaetaceae bacterium]|nr:transcription termination factor Rho [Spirochaetales bacterium]MDY5500872.1 transcription termination factor Rho [Sphaerochaetaceae bacterium]
MSDNEEEAVKVETPAQPVEKKAVVRRVRRPRKALAVKAKAPEVVEQAPEAASLEAPTESAPAIEQPPVVSEPQPEQRPEEPKAEVGGTEEYRAQEQGEGSESRNQEEPLAEGFGEQKQGGRRDFDRNRRFNNRQGRHSQRFQKNANSSNINSQRPNRHQQNEYPQDINIEEHPEAPVLNVNAYACLPQDQIRKIGVERGLDENRVLDMKNQEILAEILKKHSAAGGVITGSGTLEVLPDGFGFLRSPNNSYLSGPEDIYVSPAQVKGLGLKTGDTVFGQVRTPRDGERFFAILRVLSVNGEDPVKARVRAPFESLTPLFPNERINLETPEEDVSLRIINMFSPIGKGQRLLITAPPRTGKTVLMQKIANAITTNYPDIVLIVLLVDERPEEVTDMRRHVKGEVIASTFDEQASRHVQVAEMVIEKAKRLVEYKKDVVILLDSITRLARAYNQTVPASGKILSGGVDSNALHKPKRFFGAARNIEEGGSLTIIATGLIETGSRMDEVIFEEFKGTGNSEIILDRKLADRRIFPAMNIKKSGTRRDDLLLPADEAAKIWLCRKAVGDMDDQEVTPFLIDKIKKTKDNEAFLRSINTQG